MLSVMVMDRMREAARVFGFGVTIHGHVSDDGGIVRWEMTAR